MPNWVRNRVTFGKGYEKVLDFVKSFDSAIDFNKIIPMPESLNIESSPNTISLAYYLVKKAFRKRCDNVFESTSNEDEKELAMQYLRNSADYGYPTWYEWSIAFWGTKWNACDAEVYENVLEFSTAWASVPDLLLVLHEKFPDVPFKYEYSDEDVSYNCGLYEYKNGEMTGGEMADGSKEAFELNFALWGLDDSFELVGETYMLKKAQDIDCQIIVRE